MGRRRLEAAPGVWLPEGAAATEQQLITAECLALSGEMKQEDRTEQCSGDPEEDPSNQSTIAWILGCLASSTFCKCLGNKVTAPVYVWILCALVPVLGIVLLGIAIRYSCCPDSVVVFSPDPAPGLWCLDGWVGYQGKCYYFSEALENWNNSQRNCSALGASLAVIDREQEMKFLLRCKGKLDHWLGLWRDQDEDQDQPWKWVNGTKFNKTFEIRGGGHCAYLNDRFVGSSRCSSLTKWICSKHDAHTVGKETAQPRI